MFGLEIERSDPHCDLTLFEPKKVPKIVVKYVTMAPHWLNPFSNYSQIDDDEGHADDGDNDGDNNPNNISISPNQVSFTTHPPTPARNKHPKNLLKVTGGGDKETQSEGGGATNKSGMSEEELLKKVRK